MRKLLASFPSLGGKERASALAFFRRFDATYANNFVVDHALRVAVQEVLAVEPAPVRRKKAPAVGGIRKITKAAALRERIADADAAVANLPVPVAAPELPTELD